MAAMRRTYADGAQAFIAAGGAVSSQMPPSEQITVGLIGAGWRCRSLLEVFQHDPAVRVRPVCDIYEPNLEAGLAAAHNQAKAFRNYKALLEDRDIQAVIIATPEHWHAGMVLDALAAGNDVYVAKPVCRTPGEGVALVAASRMCVQAALVLQMANLSIKHKRPVCWNAAQNKAEI